MKKISYLILAVISICMAFCTPSANTKAHESIRSYLKEKLKNPSTYEHIFFDSLKILKEEGSVRGELYSYSMFHAYKVKNPEGVIVPMLVGFAFDKDMNIVGTWPENIDGDYSSIDGSVTFGGNKAAEQKPDFNAKVVFFPVDTFRKGLTFETTTDVNGNFTMEKILPGRYIVVVSSGNASFCPNSFIFRGGTFEQGQYSEATELIKQIAGFDFRQLKGFKEIEDKEIATNKIIANQPSIWANQRLSITEREKINNEWKNARIGFQEECFTFYQSFQFKLPPVFYQNNLLSSRAIWIERDVFVTERKSRARNIIVTDICH